jgi:hypothetical protein
MGLAMAVALEGDEWLATRSVKELHARRELDELRRRRAAFGWAGLAPRVEVGIVGVGSFSVR